MKDTISVVLEHKKFAFDKEDLKLFGIDYFESNYFQKVGNHYRVKVTATFTKTLLGTLEEQFRPVYSSNFDSFYNFYRQIDQYFKISKSNQGRSAHIDAILKHLILKANKDFDVQFESFIPKLWSEVDSFESYQFNSAFSQIMSQLIIEPSKLHYALVRLHRNTAGDGVGVNMDSGIITKGIQDYCENNYEGGKALLKIYEDGSDEFITSHHAAALAGLYRFNGEQGIERLISYSRVEDFQESVASAISVLKPKSSVEIEVLLDVLDSLNLSLDSILSYVPRTIVNFLNSDFTLAAELADSCFDKLTCIVESGNTKLINIALFQLQFLSGYKLRVFDLLKLLVNREVQLQHVWKQVDKLLMSLDDCGFFFDLIRQVKVGSLNEFKIDVVEFSLNHFRNKHEPEFSDELVNLLVDDEGMNRWKGQKIFSHFAIRSYKSFSFKTDLTKLSALNQYKLIVSVLSDFMEPRYCFQSILPLRKTQYPIVFEILISKIENLIQNFSTSVLVECEKHLDQQSPFDKLIVERVRKEVERFSQYCADKTQITEFNPKLTSTNIYKEYNSIIGEKMAETAQVAEQNRDSFLNFFQTVRLAKGGRWIGSEDNRKTELNQFKSSFQLPRDCYRIPERFEVEIARGYSEDWSEAFKPWEQIISS